MFLYFIIFIKAVIDSCLYIILLQVHCVIALLVPFV